MSIQTAELKAYRSATVSDAGSNGGRMSAVQIISAAVANLFPSVQQAERAAGGTKYRKAFFKAANDDDLTLFTGLVYLDKFTPGQDAIYFFPATQSNTQADVTGSERVYGVGTLASNVASGETSIDVDIEDENVNFFVAGDLIRITNQATINASGDEEYIAADSVTDNSDGTVTIVLATPLQNDYLSTNTRVASVLQTGDVKVATSNLVVTSGASGTVDSAHILGDNIGSIEQTWTLTFTGATAFNVVGDTVGASGSGNVGAGASPNNASFSKPYFVMQAAAFGGTWQAGDTIVFRTHPAAVPVWFKRIVPSGAAATANNSAIVVFDGETSGA